jgi:hypothetical protein
LGTLPPLAAVNCGSVEKVTAGNRISDMSGRQARACRRRANLNRAPSPRAARTPARRRDSDRTVRSEYYKRQQKVGINAYAVIEPLLSGMGSSGSANQGWGA